MKDIDLIFNNKEEKDATFKMLATFKGKKVNENIDSLIDEILKYAKEIDDLLRDYNIESSYLEEVSNLNSTNEIVLKEDIQDEKLKEQVDDLIKRINTRINLVHSNNEVLNKLNKEYDLDNVNLEEEIKKANLI